MDQFNYTGSVIVIALFNNVTTAIVTKIVKRVVIASLHDTKTSTMNTNPNGLVQLFWGNNDPTNCCSKC